jgi:hypothetical protein
LRYTTFAPRHFLRLHARAVLAETEGASMSEVEGGFGTVDQVAKFLSISRAKVYSLMDAGDLWMRNRVRRDPDWQQGFTCD